MTIGEFHHRTNCRLCGSSDLPLVLELTPTPPANAFVGEAEVETAQRCFPLDVYFCEQCAHVQLLDVVDPRILFENYVYVSGTSPVFVRHFEDYAQRLIERFALVDGDLVCDIGSNDGVFLRAFRDRGARVLGVDPAIDIAERATQSGIPTRAEFFTPALARELRRDEGAAKLVTANNVFAHADDLAGIVEGVRTLLDDDGVFVFEVSYLLDVYEKTLFDTIYHEHVAYHSVLPLQTFFAEHGMSLFDVERVGSHGGSLRGMAGPAGVHEVSPRVDRSIAEERAAGLHTAATFVRWAEQIRARGQALTAVLNEQQRRGRRIAGFGAPAKATTLMYHYGLSRDVFQFIVDDSPLKQGLYSPGLHVPVLPFTELASRDIDCVVILAWNFADSIIEKCSSFLAQGGTVVVPLPEVRVIEHEDEAIAREAS